MKSLHKSLDSTRDAVTFLRYGSTLLILLSLAFIPSVKAQNLNHYDLTVESLGGVHIDERFDQVVARIGKARSMTNPMMDPKNNCDKRVLYYDNDLEVELCSTKSRESVHSVRVVKNPKVSTAKGARTGMSLAQIKMIYPKSRTIGDHTVLIEDMRTHLRLRFSFNGGKVYEISYYREKREAVKKSKRSKRNKLMDF